MTTLFTIGFTKKTAEDFFTLIKHNHIKCVIDIRLNNASQLAGFSKKTDLEYFLKEIYDCGYRHLPILAPTKNILDSYKKKKISWGNYTLQYNALLKSRGIENLISLDDLNESCFLCSESTADHCHRRLAAEYLKNKHEQIKIVHI
ncbi:MAG: DUF488 domain-containing protein [Proteobacteria bacterium]|nr:DUF488 domain-containing protein [bacterium]MBU4133662.1 DUF488 domain-containing protein [Pseudomonadota bacterium]